MDGAPSVATTESQVIMGLRHQLDIALDRLRDARRMAAMLGRTATGFEPDPRVEVLGSALEATVEHLSEVYSDLVV